MFTFLNPALLWAAAAAVVPLILHLMQRRRRIRVPFSTLRFLKTAQRRSSNRVRIEHLLLWLLRTLTLLALALAFAAPVMRTSRLGHWLGRARRDVAMVLDQSCSMAYDSGHGAVWETARAAAAQTLAGLGPGDRACLILAGEDTAAVVEKLTPDLALVGKWIGGLEWQYGSSHLDQALLAALAAFRDSGNREREVYVFTDGQALPWQGFRSGASSWNPAAVGRNTACFVMLAGSPAPENTYPARVEVDPPVLVSNSASRVTVHIGRSGPAREVTGSLLVDEDEVGRQKAALDADGTVRLEFALSGLSPGVHAARFQTPADSLTADDAFHFVLRVHDRFPVLCIGGEDDAFFLMTALNPRAQGGAGAAAKRVLPAEAGGEDFRRYGAIFLVNALPLSGEIMLALESYARHGGLVVIFPGDGAGPSAYGPWNILPARPTEAAVIESASRVRPLRLLAQEDPLFAGFVLPSGAAPTVGLQRCLRFGAPEAGASVVISAGDDLPFLLSRQVDKGRVLCFAVSADRRWSTLPLSALFLPMVYQILQFGAGLGGQPLSIEPGRRVPVSELVPGLRQADRIVDPNGKTLTVRPVRQGIAVALETDDISAAGIYVVEREGGTREPAIAVNVNRAESHLAPVTDQTLREWTGLPDLRTARDAGELRRLVDAHRRGRPFIEPLLLLALALAAVEFFAANRMMRQRRTLSARLGVDIAGRIRGTAGRAAGAGV